MISPKITNLGYSNLWTDMSTILGYQTNLDQYISKLFANNEQGFFYDPNDLSTMYQDAAGAVPVTAVGQSVGLMLDKSKGLTFGAEKVINGNFDTDLSGWANTTNSFVWDNGKAVSTGVQGDLTQDAGGVVGKWYKCSFTLSAAVRAGAYVSFCGNDLSYFNREGSYSIITLCSSPTKFARFRVFAGDGVTIDNVSIKELAGNHAYQTVSAMRPLLVAAPQRLDYDAVDDKLTTTLPTQLTGCTVVRSVPNVGTQILTGQTLPTAYEDNKDHCGLIVINRALTPSETSAITSEFNKRAGV